jgi:hypothetical protein
MMHGPSEPGNRGPDNPDKEPVRNQGGREHVPAADTPLTRTDPADPIISVIIESEFTRPETARSRSLLLHAAARLLANNTPEGQTLKAKLDDFDNLDDEAKKRAVPKIVEDLANIVARAITETNQRREFEEALLTWKNPTLATCEPPARRERILAKLRDIAKEVLAELGKEMFFKAVFGVPGLLPPNSFVEAVFSALTLWEITEDRA